MRKICNLFITAVMMLCFSANINAQQMPEAPADPAVRTGKLENGLTYYIRHNEYPKGQVDFHIAQKVGSVQEDDNQRGLAHFLEHMCFNGTDNFPGNKIITWLESKGIKFGADLNAYTSTDRTVYRITNVPNKKQVVDSCLLILHDWADGLTLSTEEINKERGVIHEEWRGENAFMRILEHNCAKLYPNSKYADRLPIGTMDVVDNFKPEVLRAYYEKWYRPDLQGVVVVGDIDVDQMEAQIKDVFGKIKMPKDPGAFEYYPVPDNDEPILVAEADKEMPLSMFLVFVKMDQMPRQMCNTDAYYITDYIYNVIDIMMSQRMDEVSLKADAPFANASVSLGNYLLSSYKDALQLQIIVNDKGNESALKNGLLELKRVADYGFTASEYDRARNEYLSRLQKAYDNRDKQKSDTYAQEYINHFLDNTPMSGIQHEYETVNNMSKMVNVNMVNAMMKELLNGKNMVIIAAAPQKEGVTLITEAEMAKIINEVKDTKVEQIQEKNLNIPLISNLPKPGKITKEKPAKYGYTQLTLSNGATVYLRATDFKDNEILLSANSFGGESKYGDDNHTNVAVFNTLYALNGVDQFSVTDLDKMLSGKQASISLKLNGYSELINGSCVPKDAETMMQLLYLNITSPRNNKAEFDGAKQMYESVLKNQALSPDYVFTDSIQRITSSHSPKAELLKAEMLSTMDYNRMINIVPERFANAADFNFVITGNFKMDEMKKLVEQYIATLPAKKGKKETPVKDSNVERKGIYNVTFNHASENNNANLNISWYANMPLTIDTYVKASVAGQLMSKELLNNVREDEGAAYSPHAYGYAAKSYEPFVQIVTTFGFNHEKKDKSLQLTREAFENLAKEVKQDELDKIKEYMLKRVEINEHENSYWSQMMANLALSGNDYNTEYRNTVNALTPASMQKFVADILKQGNRAEIVMLPIIKK